LVWQRSRLARPPGVRILESLSPYPSVFLRAKAASRHRAACEIGYAIADRVFEEIPGYGRAAPGLITDLRAGATATVEVLTRAFAEGSTLRREDQAFLREVAPRRVHQGISLEEFIHAYRVALPAIWDACAEEASRLRISREAGFALARSAIDAIDTITTQAAEAYLREETRVRTENVRAARDLVERLIDGQPIDPGRRHPAAPGPDPMTHARPPAPPARR
jgi:hypothetical protein